MSDALVDRLDGIVHEETQRHEDGVDLTVAAVRRIDGPGRLDFGGGELTAAESSPVETRKRDPEDDYEWWHLDEGQYLLSHNETLTGEGTAVLQPRTELCERGASHPTLFTESLGWIPLSVPTGGIRLKENARVSTLRPSP